MQSPKSKKLFLRISAFISVVVVALFFIASPASAADGDGMDGVLGWLMKPMFRGVSTLLGWTLRIIQSPSTEPMINSEFFLGNYAITLKLGTFFTVPVAMVATISAIAKGGLKEVLRTYLVGFPVAILGAAAAVSIVGILQAINLNLTNAVLGDTVNGFNQWRAYVGTTWEGIGTSVAGVLGLAFFFIVILFSAIGIWFELLFRSTMIYMAMLFLPLSLATFVWAPLRKWMFSLAEIIIVMIFSKFLVSALLALGFKAMFSSMEGADVTQPNLILWFMGSWLMLMAALMGPAIIGFLLKPEFTVLSRKQVGFYSPFNADRAQTRRNPIEKFSQTFLLKRNLISRRGWG